MTRLICLDTQGKLIRSKLWDLVELQIHSFMHVLVTINNKEDQIIKTKDARVVILFLPF